MTLSLIINSVGLLLDIAGALLMYFNSKPVSYATYLYSNKELKAFSIKSKKMNKRVKLGAFLLFIGFVLQLFASWL